MCFGGSTHWCERLPPLPSSLPVGPGLRDLEEKLDYTFNNGKLLVQALTHRSTASNSLSYERMEFMGDAIVDAFITSRLKERFPNIRPGSLTLARACLVTNGLLAYLAIVELELHRHLIHNSLALRERCQEAAEMARCHPIDHIESYPFLWDPPKPLADGFEAISAAIFLDSRGDLEAVFKVLKRLFAKVLPLIPADIPPDPYSRFIQQLQRIGCRSCVFRPLPRVQGEPITVVISFHGIELVRSVHPRSINVANQNVSQQALDNDILNKHKSRCTCSKDSEVAILVAELTAWKEAIYKGLSGDDDIGSYTGISDGEDDGRANKSGWTREWDEDEMMVEVLVPEKEILVNLVTVEDDWMDVEDDEPLIIRRIAIS